MHHTHASAVAALAPRFTTAGFCGFFPPDGWLDLILDMDARLAEADPDYRIVQVKEKFGGLRYYIERDTDATRAIIGDGEARSLRTCQTCGSQDSTVARRTHGWVATLCGACDRGRPSTRGYHFDDDDDVDED